MRTPQRQDALRRSCVPALVGPNIVRLQPPRPPGGIRVAALVADPPVGRDRLLRLRRVLDDCAASPVGMEETPQRGRGARGAACAPRAAGTLLHTGHERAVRSQGPGVARRTRPRSGGVRDAPARWHARHGRTDDEEPPLQHHHLVLLRLRRLARSPAGCALPRGLSHHRHARLHELRLRQHPRLRLVRQAVERVLQAVLRRAGVRVFDGRRIRLAVEVDGRRRAYSVQLTAALRRMPYALCLKQDKEARTFDRPIQSLLFF